MWLWRSDLAWVGRLEVALCLHYAARADIASQTRAIACRAGLGPTHMTSVSPANALA